MQEDTIAIRARASFDDVAISLVADHEAAGPAQYHQVPVPGATSADSARWTAVFAAWLYRHGPAQHIHLISRESGATKAVRVPVSGADTVADVAAAVKGADVVAVSGTRTRQILAGLPADPGAYDEDVDIHLSFNDGSVSLCAGERRWTRATVEAFAHQLAALSEGSGPVAELPVLTPSERRRILVEANDTAQQWPHTDYLAPLHEQIARRPHEPALVHGSRTVTFGELESRANRIASRLRTLGARPGERVALLYPRSADYVIAAVGVLKTGAAVVPLDPANPDARLNDMIEDAGPLAVITSDELRPRVPDRVLALLADEVDDEPDHPVAIEITGETISHLIYTSGSTGRPKAVLERHGALANLVYWTERAYSVRDSDRATWLTAPGFGVQTIEWMPYLALGVPIYIGEAANPTPEQLREWLLKHRITHTLLVSALAERTWTLPWPADTVLRVMVATAERVVNWPPDDLPFKAVVTYGSTETLNVLSMLDLGVRSDVTADTTPAEVRAVRPVPAGRPMANVRVYLLDESDAPVGIGMVGRLRVAGHGMSAGYHQRPELAAEKFKPNTLPEEPDELLYDTGDLARMRTDGTIEVLGRSGSQVNIRGFRVELGEVEKVVRSAPVVAEAVVVTCEDPAGYMALAAYVAGREDGDVPEPVRVRAHVGGMLPHYMVPGVVVVLDALPRLPNGKVDRGRLPEPGERGLTGAPAAEPKDPVERELHAIWTTLFRRDGISTTDHFFELGGHSLLAFRLIGKVREAFAVEISLPELWDSPTIERLAALISSRRETACDEGGEA